MLDFQCLPQIDAFDLLRRCSHIMDRLMVTVVSEIYPSLLAAAYPTLTLPWPGALP
jgi:hypothetical protein